MSSAPAAARPPSPPTSIHEDSNVAEEKASTIGTAPYTPPATVKPIPYQEAVYVSDIQYEDPPLPGLPPQGQYDDPTLYQLVPTDYQFQHQMQPAFGHGMPYHTPPTVPFDHGIHTRSGRLIGTPLTPEHPDTSRRTGSPIPKRKNKPKPKSKSSPIIDEPLSLLTRDYRLPIRDMEAWVNRSAASRQEEARNRKDKRIPRPMNSFMLYRSAYSERTKQYCRENNHQVVSQVTGLSWPLEPKEIREFYERLAVIERDNHSLAHPAYKFAPNKDGKRKYAADDDDESDAEWGGSTRSIKRARAGKREDTRSLTSSPFGTERGYVDSYQSSPALNPSSYQAVNPFGPQPLVLGQNGLNQGMYGTVVPYGHRIEEVHYRPIEHPYHQYDINSQLVSMPKNDNLISGVDILGSNISYIDPRLGGADSSYQYASYAPAAEQTYEIPRSHAYQSAPPDATYQTDSHPGMATLTEGHDVWNETGAAGLDFDQELMKWG